MWRSEHERSLMFAAMALVARLLNARPEAKRVFWGCRARLVGRDDPDGPCLALTYTHGPRSRI